MNKGKFIDFYLPYRDSDNNEISPNNQAASLLKKAQTFIEDGSIGVGIIYSANYQQTIDIRKAYENGAYKTRISGANQAEVMMAMEELLGSSKFQELQGKMHIAPITTLGYRDMEPMNVIQNDLKCIQHMLDNGWAILGWQNQDTIHTDHPYAIGGGIVTLPTNISNEIQNRLKEFAKDYK